MPEKPNLKSIAESGLHYVSAQISKGQEWYVYCWAVDPATGAWRRKRRKINRIKDLKQRQKYGEKLAAKWNEALENGWNPWVKESTSDPAVTIAEAVRIFLKKKLRHIEKDSVRSYRSQTKRFLEFVENQKLTNIRVDHFTTAHGRAYLDHLIDHRGIGELTHNNYLTFCRLMFNWFIENDISGTNPFAKIKKLREKEKSRMPIPPAVRSRIKEYFAEHNPMMNLCCQLLFYTEIRNTEQTKLRVGDIDIDQRIIHLPGDYTKNHKSRFPTIPDVFAEYLVKEKWLEAPKNHFLIGDKFQTGTKEMDPREISRQWERMRRALEIPMKYKFYSLRDSGIDHMLTEGIDPNTVRKQAGHSSLSITSIYADRISPKANEKIKNLNKGF